MKGAPQELDPEEAMTKSKTSWRGGTDLLGQPDPKERSHSGHHNRKISVFGSWSFTLPSRKLQHSRPFQTRPQGRRREG
jgi:hypothetical protein